MAITFTVDGATLVIPQAVASIKVETQNSGLATNGVLMLVGEAESGPRFSLEESLQDNAFGPDQLGAVQLKYGSGPIVDAFSAAAVPANDPNIVGAPQRIIIVKTNESAKASSLLSGYGTLSDRGYGKLGNSILYTITESQAEQRPTSGPFTLLVPPSAAVVRTRVNGGAVVFDTLAALTLPSAAVAQINALTDVEATGGALKTVLTADPPGPASFITITTGALNSIVVSCTLPWLVAPAVGDTLYIPSTSNFAGGGNTAGSYVVTAFTASTITATKLMDVGAVSVTAPVAVPSTGVTLDTHLELYSMVTISVEPASAAVVGAGRSLEIADENAVVPCYFSDLAYKLDTTTLVAAPVPWVSAPSAPKLLTAATEQKVTLATARQVDNISESLVAGGEVALKVGYAGTTATLTITNLTLATTVVGGVGVDFSVDLKDFPTVSDLATFINSKPGYTAAIGNGILGQLPSTALDRVVGMGIATEYGAQAGRVKIDAYRFFTKVGESFLVEFTNLAGAAARADRGFPALVPSITYLAGGTRGGTSDADIAEAFLALERTRGNFVIPLFSRDAQPDDAAEDLTDASSTYTIEAVVAQAKSHVLKMSTLKAKRNRMAFVGLKDTFADVKEVASNSASFRVVHPFQDVRTLSSNGSVKQHAPWMAAVIAAAMQAAGFYRALVRKFANISGALQAAGDFDDQDDTAMEDAILSGLLPLRKAETGGFYWVTDQTSYGKDANFVFNSIQATYVADVIALTTAQRMENAFVGQSVADVNAAMALAFLEGIMLDFLRLKLIAPSDDAPLGFRNAKIKISGTAMIVSVEVKLAGALYFIPISILVSQVQQTA